MNKVEFTHWISKTKDEFPWNDKAQAAKHLNGILVLAEELETAANKERIELDYEDLFLSYIMLGMVDEGQYRATNDASPSAWRFLEQNFPQKLSLLQKIHDECQLGKLVFNNTQYQQLRIVKANAEHDVSNAILERMMTTSIEHLKDVPKDKLWYLLMDRSVHWLEKKLFFNYFHVSGVIADEEGRYLHEMTKTWFLMLQTVNNHVPLSSDLLLSLHESLRPGRVSAGSTIPIKTHGFCGMGSYPFMKQGVPCFPICSEAAKQEWENEKLILDLRQIPDNEKAKVNEAIRRNEYIAIYVSEASEWIQLPDVSDFIRQTKGCSAEEAGQLRAYFDHHRLSKKEHCHSLSGLPVDAGTNNTEDIIALATNKKRPLVDKLIAEYYANLDQAQDNPEEKLLAIVRFIRKIEIAHPFVDYNQRLFVFIVLNKLLLENGFLPVILRSPYIFDGYFSAKELVSEVKLGFQNYLQTVHGIKNFTTQFDSASPAFFKAPTDLSNPADANNPHLPVKAH